MNVTDKAENIAWARSTGRLLAAGFSISDGNYMMAGGWRCRQGFPPPGVGNGLIVEHWAGTTTSAWIPKSLLLGDDRHDRSFNTLCKKFAVTATIILER